MFNISGFLPVNLACKTKLGGYFKASNVHDLYTSIMVPEIPKSFDFKFKYLNLRI